MRSLPGILISACAGCRGFNSRYVAKGRSWPTSQRVLATIVSRVRALVARHGLHKDDASDPAEESPALAGRAATPVEGLAEAGAERRRPARLGAPGETTTIRRRRPATGSGTDSTRTPAYACALVSAIGSNGSAGMPCGRRPPNAD
jgi:hypothetical protein